ncbi:MULTISPECIES: alanine racemase [unclassified Luteococcus]|uniref:alanine racemase n=1 Tax=unclassified Luteococcus TaxID=2639923 RepID=UPI00313E4410
MFYATHACVDLAAIRRNLLAVRERVGGRQVMLAVKGNAYGHGAVEVSRMVERTGCADRLAIATVPEGIELREAGITLPILKLSHCFEWELEAALKADLVLTVVDELTIDQARGAAQRLGVTAKVHLKVDTGMRRIGTEPSQAEALVRWIDACPNLELEGIFTHPPVSDMADETAYTVAELTAFRELVDRIQAERGPIDLVHAAPSGVILAHDLAGTTAVRAGIMAYGYYPDASTPRTVALEPAMSMVSRVTFVKQISAGESVGYGRTWVAPRDTWIATVCVGYADGWSRRNTNTGRMLVGGRSYPVVGRVCMDQTMVDLGPEDPQVGVGDEVVLLGRQGDQVITADDLAAIMQTISYEVTCLITARVPRVYQDDEA